MFDVKQMGAYMVQDSIKHKKRVMVLYAITRNKNTLGITRVEAMRL